MSAENKVHDKLKAAKQEREELTLHFNKLSKIEEKLHKTDDESRPEYLERVVKVADEIKEILSEKKWSKLQTSEPQLMRAVVRKEVERVSKKLAHLEKKISDYQNKSWESITYTTKDQV